MTDSLAGLEPALAGKYRIERLLGTGGMATVYLATDLRHQRQVALKVLRSDLSAVIGADRFLQEIRVTANLQHPGILPLFDSGAAGNTLFYVMPYAEGESLRTRLEREPQLPIDEALRVGSEIAQALEYAHKRGLVHRDIKPENVLFHEGRALVADFGLAFAIQTAGGSRLTESGLALGTPQYMSPEQGAGEMKLDARTDVYSLGCVIYEMLAGEPPHQGPTAQAILSRVMTEEPRALTSARPTVAPAVATAVHRAIQRLPADRFSSAGQLALAITSGPHEPVTLPLRVPSEGRTRWSPFLVFLVAIVLLAGGVALGKVVSPRPDATTVVRMTVGLPPNQRLDPVHPQPAISSDGSTLAYIAIENDTSRLYLRPLSSFETHRVPGSENADFAFFSPDGGWIAFFVRQDLFKAPIGGGAATKLGTFPRTGRQWDFDGGATWGVDGRIYIGQKSLGLWSLSQDGGPATQVTVPDSAGAVRDFGHAWPKALPDGSILFMSWGFHGGQAAILIPTDKRVVPLGPAGVGDAWYSTSGHLIYQTEPGSGTGVLTAFQFNLRRRETRTAGTRILEDAVGHSVAMSGRTATYVARPGQSSRRLAWIDRAGRESPVATDQGPFRWPSLSPDGRRLLYHDQEVAWIMNLETKGRLPLNVGSRIVTSSWTPDGHRIVFSCVTSACATGASGQAGADLYSRTSDGTGETAPFFQGPLLELAPSFSPDGNLFAMMVVGSIEPGDIEVASRDGAVVASIAGPGRQSDPRISPDGKWLAYESNETGRAEIYVQPFPRLDHKYPISSEGGREPVWSHDGRELFFRNGDRMMVVTVGAGTTFSAEPPRVLFSGMFRYASDNAGGSYDVARDGRFLAIATSPPEIHVVVNFAAELERTVPR